MTASPAADLALLTTLRVGPVARRLITAATTAQVVAAVREHPGALILGGGSNRGGASSADILALARTVRDGVRAAFGITLEPEPVLVGCRL